MPRPKGKRELTVVETFVGTAETAEQFWHEQSDAYNTLTTLVARWLDRRRNERESQAPGDSQSQNS